MMASDNQRARRAPRLHRPRVPLGDRRRHGRAARHGLLPVVGVHFAWLRRALRSRGVLLTTVILALHVLPHCAEPALMIQPAPTSRRAAPASTHVAQKLMHLGWTVAVLLAIGTGLAAAEARPACLLERDPYVRCS
jgi:hypothetical protein